MKVEENEMGKNENGSDTKMKNALRMFRSGKRSVRILGIVNLMKKMKQLLYQKLLICWDRVFEQSREI